MQQISVVVVPSPFRETHAATMAVAMRTFMGSPLAKMIIFLVMGSNMPASSMIEKYRMANRSMMPVLDVVLMPLLTHPPSAAMALRVPPSPSSNPLAGTTPAIRATIAKTSGTMTSAVSGDSFLVMMMYMNTAIMTHARMVRTTFPPFSLSYSSRSAAAARKGPHACCERARPNGSA